MHYRRRSFLKVCGATGIGMALEGGGYARTAEASSDPRRFHVCAAPQVLDAAPDLLDVFARSGIGTVWMAGFFYGYWPVPVERIAAWRKRVEDAGMAACVVNIPLGHPGDSLGTNAEPIPLTPGKHWMPAADAQGKRYMGTSLHPPATEENRGALRQLAGAGMRRVFLDDDFRLARGPGIIGGCYCDAHRDAFLKSRGYADGQWEALLDAVRTRSCTDVLREWVNFTCDELTDCFRAQQAAARHIALGIMVMYFGAEKAGIRLRDYRGVPLRVGELMFDDASFATIKNKTAELFSCLFHRRFVSPKHAYSETTAFPADKLCAKNMAAKLAISTLADVRNTMFMSGITPFPREHWDTLAPAMRKQAQTHAVIAGHEPRGPFKHYWGEYSRFVGDDNPYSLFLATGVPFEVSEKPAGGGWTFLSDADARALSDGALRAGRTTFVTRPSPGAVQAGARAVEESLPALFALKHEIVPKLRGVPYVEDDKPVVCAWYPTARAAVLWNLSESRETFRLRCGSTVRTAEAEGLDTVLLTGIGAA